MKSQPPQLTCHLLDTGYCLAWEDHVIRGGEHRRIHCHSIVALLQHPEHGWLLWDTGYAQRMFEVTQRFPFWLYRKATPLHIPVHSAVIDQLNTFGLTATDISYVLISHFHADHICGLLDFPAAQFIAAERAYRDIANRRGFSALRRAFIPALLPSDFQKRAILLPDFTGPELPGLGATHDLFGDGSLLLVSLPGHACGQMGMLAQTEQAPILFAADGCWLTRAIRERKPPHWLTYGFIDDARAMKQTLHGLATFAYACPDVTIIPTHCPEAFARELKREP